MSIDRFSEVPPESDGLTEYDRDHIKLYCRLLDSVAAEADWQEAVQILFGLDAAAQPDRARRVYDSHLARARWMTHTGYKHLLRQSLH